MDVFSFIIIFFDVTRGQYRLSFDFSLSFSFSLFFSPSIFEPSAALRSGCMPDGTQRPEQERWGNRKQFTQCQGIKYAEASASAS